jgi:hypothetical protein
MPKKMPEYIVEIRNYMNAIVTPVVFGIERSQNCKPLILLIGGSEICLKTIPFSIGEHRTILILAKKAGDLGGTPHPKLPSFNKKSVGGT